MVSLIEELEAREAGIVELTSRLAGEREAWSRLRVARETVTEVLAELAGQDVAEPVTLQEPVEPEVRVVGAVMVPHWREGLKRPRQLRHVRDSHDGRGRIAPLIHRQPHPAQDLA
ncbi:hypothetical protein QF035_011026 [Streptomyces umbrinus]|uniref:Uncharacterized protein n=1 Tax=Streptomyces umbrinus TaxID=67370 RepID=A0ABU0TF31_9ACTN|nr:hypothetical protein [Streptomyces umbrinus]MDQ1033444.1 hypothetical protein [Streptomyces umbrinus]